LSASPKLARLHERRRTGLLYGVDALLPARDSEAGGAVFLAQSAELCWHCSCFLSLS